MTGLPHYEPAYIHSTDQLRGEVRRLGLGIPVNDDVSGLHQPLVVEERTVPNRFCSLPIRAMDAASDGSPGRLTQRRSLRVAAGGFGLIWLEGVEVDVTCPPVEGHLRLTSANGNAFRAWVETLRAAGHEAIGAAPVVLLQLVCSRKLKPATDEDLARLREAFVQCAGLAEAAGFDGVDVVCAHRGLLAEALVAVDRPGPYGGSWDGRTRLIREIHEGIRQAHPGLLRSARVSGYDAREAPQGFGVDGEDYRKPSLDEPVALARLLAETGVSLMQISAASPNLRGDASERPQRPLDHLDPPHEHPLTDLARRIDLARAIHAAVPSVALVSDGAVWLRQWWAQVAAGGIVEGTFAMAGMGRGALAYPDAPLDLKRTGSLAPEKTCMACYACSALHRQGGPTGCIVRDPEEYGAALQDRPPFDRIDLWLEAKRCHQCEAAPCRAASPHRTPFPAILKAWEAGDERKAWELLRGADVLPELGALVSPIATDIEPACIERALSGRALALGDLQWTIARSARDRGWTGVSLPESASGRRVAVVGGGPCGVAAAATLLERGHAVTIYEGLEVLGGAPEATYGLDRHAGGGAEVEALLGPALEVDRLTVRLATRVGREVSWEQVKGAADAVIVSTGVWEEPGLGFDSRGKVQGALDFLQQARAGVLGSLEGGVALLAGGDAAMDAARVAWLGGARPVHVIFDGPRSTMHWHMAEAWFAEEGVKAMMLTRAVQVVCDSKGRLCGLKVEAVGLNGESLEDTRTTVSVSRIINATGLAATAEAKEWMAEGLEAGVFAAGGVINGGASVGRCVAEGMTVAQEVDSWLERL